MASARRTGGLGGVAFGAAERTKELQEAVQRYEVALRGSLITVFTQDRDLRYTSITNPLFGLPVAALIAVAVTSGVSLFVRLLLTRAEIKSPWPGAS